MIEIQRWLYSAATGELKNIASGADAVTLVSAMGVAALFGFVHALMPGHGKVALVSYYIGHPGRLLGSIGTSAVLILTHVGSAVILVLAGFTVIRATLGGVGRAPAFEAASAALVIVVGIWLLVRASRHEHAAQASSGLLVPRITGSRNVL
jgi:ABC-type nickel/cobalt efflux system permease component RcnA